LILLEAYSRLILWRIRAFEIMRLVNRCRVKKPFTLLRLRCLLHLFFKICFFSFVKWCVHLCQLLCSKDAGSLSCLVKVLTALVLKVLLCWDISCVSLWFCILFQFLINLPIVTSKEQPPSNLQVFLTTFIFTSFLTLISLDRCLYHQWFQLFFLILIKEVLQGRNSSLKN